MAGKSQRQADESVDRFVERVRTSPREPLFYDEVPDFLRDGAPVDAVGYQVPWTILSAPGPCAWLEEFEARLPGRLPRSYKSLISRFLFPAFDVGPVRLFANTGAGVQDELVAAVFRDPGIHAPLLAAGFVQFGRPSTGRYDPVCFDLNRRTNGGECPVVQLDHEAALMLGQVRVVAELAPDFLSLVEGGR